jgi:outer membrane protein OmpA-like peptidoglycan-associated protein
MINCRLLIAFLAACILLSMPAIAGAQAEDHPVIERYPGSTLLENDYVHRNYDSMELYVTVEGETTTKIVKGEYWEILYEIYDESGDKDDSISGLEIAENYKNAALEKGGEILYDAGDVFTFSIPMANGNTCWVYFEAGGGWYSLYIIEEEGLVQVLHFGEDEIKKELDSKGHIAIYGITFEFDKADLKVGAETQLIEIVKLMRNNHELKIEIQGHTDNVGGDEYNQDLSERRAETVKDFLLLYGVSADRMRTKGFGESSPVASNDTEEGRSMNRRVEIVKID